MLYFYRTMRLFFTCLLLHLLLHAQHPPVFSVSGGWHHPDSLDQIALRSDSASTIFYTLDGSVPNPRIKSILYNLKNQYPQHRNSNVYPFLCDSTTTYIYSSPLPFAPPEHYNLSHKSSTFDEDPAYFPSENLPKGQVIRALSKHHTSQSSVVTHTYFPANIQHNFPVLALSIAPHQLFDYDEGIYCAGKHFEDWRSKHSHFANGMVPANWRGKGRASEVTAFAEWFDHQKATVRQTIGVRIHGGSSRIRPRKSLRIYARDTSNGLYLPHFSSTGDTVFKRVLLRNAGNDANNTLFRDAFMQHLLAGTQVDIQQSTPAIVYINGEYWGIHNLREWQNHHYINRKYGIAQSNMDFLKEKRDVKEGDAGHFRELMTLISTDEWRMDQIEQRMDLNNFTDYIIGNVYVRNTDWPHNNIKMWRKRSNFSEGVHDGRWRWLHNDLDHGFGLYGGWEAYAHNTLNYAQKSYEIGFLLKMLMRNDTFATAFANRFCDLLNTTFTPENVIAMVDSFAALYRPEMALHLTRWNADKTVEKWEKDVDVLRQFAIKRPDYVLHHLAVARTVQQHHTITLQFSNQGMGSISLNTIIVNRQSPGFGTDAQTWQGKYLEAHPLHLRALDVENGTFLHWIINGKKQRKADLQITLKSNTTVEAVYK